MQDSHADEIKANVHGGNRNQIGRHGRNCASTFSRVDFD
jgi:hypothetical protein